MIDKTQGYRIVKTVGFSAIPEEIDRLVALGRAFIEGLKSQYSLFPKEQQRNATVLDFVSRVRNSQIRTIGPELVFGKLFDRLGFGAIPENLFRDIVITRLVYPSSKVKTVDYLYRYQGKVISVDSVYRFLDKLNDQYKEQVERIAYCYSQSVLESICVVFYDMTTLYFENEDEDDLRKIGFSKDGKFQHPQIMLGLLVGKNGYPIGYDIFEGNTFEGHTLLPVLEGIEQKYGFGRPVVVADAAMLSNQNIRNLGNAGYQFVVGARLRNETEKIQREILRRSVGLKNGESFAIKKPNGHRLIVSYSDKRASKDSYNRGKGLKKLRRRVRSGKLTKEQINNRGFNKFLRLRGEVKVEIDESKIEEAVRWDGLKGYLTNTNHSADTIIENYQQLWHVEKAFRISKTDLRIRPIHHYKEKRIKAHVCIAFVAYTIYKELERLLNESRVPISPQRAVELTHTMYEIIFELPDDPEPQNILLQMDKEQKMIYDLLR
ncbi:MAG: IS1634 family transposase [candidate division Zixibacteria bacterium]|nr:IS1634 family transposase [candidate division Zixibacteria bacterium]